MPKYARLFEQIRNDIQNRHLLPNEQLPTEDELAAKYNLSRGTVRKAVAELQQQGFVRKEQGRGTFVNEQKPTLNTFSLVEFDHYARSQNRIPGTQTRHFETIEAPAPVAQKLNLEPDSPVFYIVQLRLVDDEPLVYEERYLATSLCPDLTRDELEKYALHWLLIEKYKIPLVQLSHTIKMIDLPADKHAIFGTEDAFTVFTVDRLSYTKTNETVHPAVWYQSLYRADAYQFQAQFHTSL
ncbi:MAG: GntR family transcriptional regulator [Aggregatilineales bacterium]